MEYIYIKLSGTIIPIYGNPLELKEGEIRRVPFTSEIKSLFKNGVIVYGDYVEENIVIEKNIKLNISGIGPKTLDDINKIYNDKEELIDALKEDKVPLYDHIVEKLKKYFKVK